MELSVVIPTYKRPQLLSRCLGALLVQNFDKENYEILVVSDGPDKETADLMDLYLSASRPVIKYLSSPVNKGPAACRNLGWLNASGKLIAFTDDDCIPTANWLQTIHSAYKGTELIAFTGRVVVPRSESPTDYEINTSNLETAEFVTANCACTKNALLKVGGFDERFSMAWREDSDLHFKFIEHQISIERIQATVVHPVRKAPWGVSIKEQKKGIFNALLYKKYPGLYRERIQPRPSLNYYAMILLFASSVVFLIVGFKILSFISITGWLVLQAQFIRKRLEATSKRPSHITEMVITSVVIPFLSIYWQFYGALKFKVLYL